MSATRTAIATTLAALCCLGSLSACGPENGDDKNAAPPATAAPATGAAAPTTGAAAPTTPGGGQAKPSSGAAAPTGGGAAKGIPAGAWINPRSIPLDSTHHWAAPADHAKPAGGAVAFKLQELCHSKLSKDVESLGTGQAAAQALIGPGGEQWQAQQTLLYQGDPRPSSGVAQSTHAVFTDLRDELKNCAKTAPGATVNVTSPEDGMFFAATVTLPQSGGGTVTLHEYLTVPDGTVNELSLWTTAKAGAQPKVPWAGPADAEVAKAMDSALCSTLKDC
ncbi:hypothetical protein ACGFZP_30415 [Kitasatospora sp. NPDC048239]|uniref:hypothetical protein n=1 Tax=Kitasatospora sp. NPDC048239 TaxID=3364046 RepID=UPI00371418C3